MKYQRKKQKKRTIIVSPCLPLNTIIKEEVEEVEEVVSGSSSEHSYQSDDGGIEHFLKRRVHPRKGTSKKLFPAHASK